MATYDRLKAAAAEVQAAVNELVSQPAPTPTPEPTPTPTPDPGGGLGLINTANPVSGWGGESDHTGGAWSSDNGVLSADNGRLVVTSSVAHQLASAVKQISGLPAGQSKTLTVVYEADAAKPTTAGVSVLSFAGGLTRLVDEKALSGSGTFTKAFKVPSDGTLTLYLMAYTARDGVARFKSATIS